uniref:Hemimethylated DNA-binding domain-containing protein n=1 Tax=Plectus sambesii TaxID=2011161 RepID=A0A914UVA4_9BILA
MPEFTRVQFIQLALLLLAVPVQYLLSRSSSENFRQYELKRVFTDIGELNSYLSLTGWLKWCRSLLEHLRKDQPDDSPPPEVLENQKVDNGFFGSSTEPRAPRPPHVKFRVGQVFKHKVHGYRAVIIGWDETAKAPKDWLDKMHTNRIDLRTLPNYSVIIDTRDRLTPQIAYVPEENIELVENVKIMHPLVEHYFEQWDGAQYLLRPWLRKVYPQD